MPPATKQKNSSAYDAHPSLGMYQSSLAALKQKTGRTLEEWIKLVQKSGPATEKDRRAWLKTEYGMGMNYAGWIAEHSVGKGDDGNPETYLRQAQEFVENMFSGGKQSLLPIRDVKVCPGKAIVPLYLKHVFAQIKPTTRTRIDLGLALKDTKVPKRLIDTGGLAKKDRITHRIEITSLKDIDSEVKKWLKTVYEMDC